MKFSPGRSSLTNFAVAVNRGRSGQDDQRTEQTDWFRVVCWNKLAETADQYLKKGSRVYARARLALQRGGSQNRGRGIRDHRADPHWFSAIWLDASIGPASGQVPSYGSSAVMLMAIRSRSSSG